MGIVAKKFSTSLNCLVFNDSTNSVNSFFVESLELQLSSALYIMSIQEVIISIVVDISELAVSDVSKLLSIN